jgi:hypothetical protein
MVGLCTETCRAPTARAMLTKRAVPRPRLAKVWLATSSQRSRASGIKALQELALVRGVLRHDPQNWDARHHVVSLHEKVAEGPAGLNELHARCLASVRLHRSRWLDPLLHGLHVHTSRHWFNRTACWG